MSKSAVAQTGWVQPGAEWHYDFLNVVSTGVFRIIYEKDSIISGKNCQVLKGNRFDAIWDQNNNYKGIFGNSYSDYYYLFTHGDTVEWMNNGDFEILYDFSAVKGDEWKMNYKLNNCDSSLVKVHSVGSDTFGGKTLTVFNVYSPPSSSYKMSKYVERIGCLEFLFPTKNTFCDSNALQEHEYYQLHCYKDNTFSYKTSYFSSTFNHSCDEIYRTGINELREEEIAVSPNPVMDILRFSNSNQLSEIEIYNLNGRIVLKKVGINEIDVSSLNSGMYMVVLYDQFGNISKNKIIKL